MNDLPAVAAETKNTTTVTILHVIVAKNGLYVLGLPRDSPLLAVTDERRESPEEKPVAFQTCQMQFFHEVPHFFPLFVIVLNAEPGRRASWKLKLGSVARKEGESEG